MYTYAGIRPTRALLPGFVVLLLMALVVEPEALAAQSTGSLEGQVVEAGGGPPVGGAEVRLEGTSRRTTLAGADGRWRLDGLPTGPYELRVEHLGYGSWQGTTEVSGGGSTSLRVELTPRPFPLDALVVTAGRRTQRLADAPVATELVSAREIRETGATDLASVLTERTGLELQGGHPAGAGVMIQGMGSERVLILMDGQPFIGRISGTIDISRIPTSMIERVEVVKGPQSTLYGSEAMGGVVNVITRAPAGRAWSTAATATAGDRGRMDLSVNALGGTGRVHGVVDLGRRSIELAPGQPGEGGALSRRWDGLGKVGWDTPVAGLRVEASGLLLEERQSWRSGQLGHFADNTQWSGRLGGVLERGDHRVALTVYGTAFDHLARTATGAEPLPGTGEEESQRLQEAELLWGTELGRHAVDAGVEYAREQIISGRVADGRREEETTEGFAQATFSWAGLSLVPGLRTSWSDLWGTHWTPRLAALWRPRPEVGIRVSAGQGFRAPSFKELSMQFLNVGPGFGYTVRGNPELEAETSRNLTASVEWAGDRSWIRVQAFENRFQDFIETRVVGDSSGIQVYSYGNVDDGFTRGAELEAGLTVDRWSVEGGWSLLRAERSQTGEVLLGRPEQSGRGHLGVRLVDGVRLSVTGVYTGTTPLRRTEEGEVEDRPAFLRFDARAAWRLPAGVELTAGVDNVLDEQIPDWPGLTGRHLYTAVSWRAVGGG